MSDSIPFEIQAEIMKWFPIKSLIQFRCVSKQWNSLITSSEFIADYHVNNTQPPEHIFVSYFDNQSCQRTYVLFPDDDTFPINKFFPEVPLSVSKLLNELTVIGSSNGLFCLYSVDRDKTFAVIWNPTIRKSVDIDLDIVLDWSYEDVIGFGVSPHTLDLKIVKVRFLYVNFHYIHYVPWQVEVFTLSLGVWRKPLCNSLPRESMQLTKYVVDINGFLYFLGYEWIVPDHDLLRSYMVISFDLKTEEFTEIRLPDTLANTTDDDLVLSKLHDSVAIFEFSSENRKEVYNVWMMENDVQRSVTKLFTVNPNNGSIRSVFGFRKSGELLFEVKTGVEEQDGLCVYEPYSKHMSYVGGFWNSLIFFAGSYTESLLLLNH